MFNSFDVFVYSYFVIEQVKSTANKNVYSGSMNSFHQVLLISTDKVYLIIFIFKCLKLEKYKKKKKKQNLSVEFMENLFPPA